MINIEDLHDDESFPIRWEMYDDKAVEQARKDFSKGNKEDDTLSKIDRREMLRMQKFDNIEINDDFDLFDDGDKFEKFRIGY